MRRLVFGIITLLLLGTEVLIGLYATGWIRSYLGDVLVVILIYTLIRTIMFQLRMVRNATRTACSMWMWKATSFMRRT